MKNNDSISQHGLFCFTKGPGGWRGAGAGRCVAGLPFLPMLPMLVATGWGMATMGRTGPSWPADGAAVPRVPSLPVTRCNTPHISPAADTVTVSHQHYYNTPSPLPTHSSYTRLSSTHLLRHHNIWHSDDSHEFVSLKWIGRMGRRSEAWWQMGVPRAYRGSARIQFIINGRVWRWH